MRKITSEILLSLILLLITIVLFVTEILRVDVVAILIMISLPWLGLISPIEAFSGFASNAVIAIIGVMIIGYGVDRSGVIEKITRPIVKLAGSSENRLVGLVSLTVGGISSFMQNIGAAALFLPSMLRISKEKRITASRLLMPMGFAAILGGTLTLFASSPLIMLNDLLTQEGISTFKVFSVTPLGIILLISGIGYFLIFGKFILPKREDTYETPPEERLIETFELPTQIYRCSVPKESPLLGKTPEEVKIWSKYNLHLLSITKKNDTYYAPWRHTPLGKGDKLAILGSKENVEQFVNDYQLKYREKTKKVKDLKKEEEAGFAEIIIPPRAPIIGKTMRELEFRKIYRTEPIVLLKGESEEKADFSDQKLEPGDSIIVYGRWNKIEELDDSENFVLVTPVETKSTAENPKPKLAIGCFIFAILLATLGFRLSLSLMTGALAMIILGVVPIREAYEAIDWRTVFLIAGLIPLGIAMDKTGAAYYIATQLMQILSASHPIIILVAIAGLATLFTLVMSNVAATVLLIPISIAMANAVNLNPAASALLVAVCASNSFLLPTHQVNALIMSPGGYKNSDFIKAGGLLSIIFIIISVSFIYLFYM